MEVSNQPGPGYFDRYNYSPIVPSLFTEPCIPILLQLLDPGSSAHFPPKWILHLGTPKRLGFQVFNTIPFGRRWSLHILLPNWQMGRPRKCRIPRNCMAEIKNEIGKPAGLKPEALFFGKKIFFQKVVVFKFYICEMSGVCSCESLRVCHSNTFL